MAYNDTPIICNGFKDAEFIEMAMLAQKIGRKIIPVVEKYTELDLILEYAEKIGVRPKIGMRVKLAARGARALASVRRISLEVRPHGDRNASGLEELKSRGMQDCFKLLHFHLGSQITNIRHIKGCAERSRPGLYRVGQRGAGLEYLDVGGGLGVDYDGSQTNFESSVNYTLAGIRQRRGLSHATRVRRCRRASTHHRFRKRPRQWWHTTVCWCSACWAFRDRGRTACRRKSPPEGGAAADRLAGNISEPRPCATCWKATTMPSSRSTWR